MKNKFSYLTQDYFPPNIKLLGGLFFVVGLLALVLAKFLAGTIFLLLGILIFTTKYGIAIDIQAKSYHDFLSIVGYKNGKKHPFQSIEYLYITSGKKTTTMQLRANATTITKLEFNGYIKFSEDEKVHLSSSEKKEKVENFLNQMSSDLKVEVRDLSK